MCGDPTLPNYGTPVGLPYGVPEAVPPTDEAAYLAPVQPERGARVGRARGGRATACSGSSGRCCPRATSAPTASPAATRSSTCPPGYRRVPHYDHQHHTRRYYALARKLEDEARDWFTDGEARRDRREVRGRRGDRPRGAPDGVSAAARDGAASSRRSRAATISACAARCASGSSAAARRSTSKASAQRASPHPYRRACSRADHEKESADVGPKALRSTDSSRALSHASRRRSARRTALGCAHMRAIFALAAAVLFLDCGPPKSGRRRARADRRRDPGAAAGHARAAPSSLEPPQPALRLPRNFVPTQLHRAARDRSGAAPASTASIAIAGNVAERVVGDLAARLPPRRSRRAVAQRERRRDPADRDAAGRGPPRAARRAAARRRARGRSRSTTPASSTR